MLAENSGAGTQVGTGKGRRKEGGRGRGRENQRYAGSKSKGCRMLLADEEGEQEKMVAAEGETRCCPL